MGLAGLAASFAPGELLAAIGVQPAALLTLGVQLLGSLYVGFALLNWTARGNAIGGIYGRPVALGNFVHFTVGALALVKGTPHGSLVPLVPAFVYGVFAILFGFVVFGRSPVRPTGTATS